MKSLVSVSLQNVRIAIPAPPVRMDSEEKAPEKIVADKERLPSIKRSKVVKFERTPYLYSQGSYMTLSRKLLTDKLKPEMLEPFLKVLTSISTSQREQFTKKGLTEADFYIQLIYEALGLLESGVKIKAIVEDFRQGKFQLKNSLFAPYFSLDQDRKEAEVEEGLYPCRKCKTMKTHSFQRQLRSADEGMTTFVVCKACDLTYKFNT